MGGGLMQLVAYGAQDIYLTGNPQITFFKVIYRRHTNFSMEAIQQTWAGVEPSSSSTSVSRCTSTISRNGDLIHRLYLEIDGTLANSRKNPTAQSIDNLELEIGGQLIDKQSGEWMNVWSLLTESNPTGYSGNIGPDAPTGTLFQNMSGMGGGGTKSSNDPSVYFVPLQFWFCRNPGLALPLIALQYHEVKINMDHNFGSTNFQILNSTKLFADYIYLDTDERRRFAQVSHEYLIEQVQEETLTGSSGKIGNLNFNHPVKELVWIKSGDGGGSSSVKAGSSNNPEYTIKLNGHERFESRDYRYFTRAQIWQHHTGPGGLVGNAVETTNFSDGIAVYSFALKPEEHQPSGTCNFSRIDSAELISTEGNYADKIFAVNYNVLRIMSGMGGLAYSN
jgi:hypothetical protein